jgi:hypothetical protein
MAAPFGANEKLDSLTVGGSGAATCGRPVNDNYSGYETYPHRTARRGDHGDRVGA